MREKGEFYPSGGVTGPEDLSVVRSPESAGPKNLRRIYLRRENESRGRSARTISFYKKKDERKRLNVI